MLFALTECAFGHQGTKVQSRVLLSFTISRMHPFSSSDHLCGFQGFINAWIIQATQLAHQTPEGESHAPIPGHGYVEFYSFSMDAYSG